MKKKTACQDKKESRSCIGLWQAMKSGSIFRILKKEILSWSRPIINIFLKLLRTEDDAVRLVGSEGCHLLRTVKPGETVNVHFYHQQLIKLHRALREKRPHYRKRYDKLIFLHDNTPSHTSTIVQNYLKTLNWEMLPHSAYSTDLVPSDYHLFSSMGHALAERHFDSLTKTSENGLMSDLPRKMRNFFGVVYTNCPKDGKNV